ncbi:MAG: LytTR family DNA-binding domain-containing protein [Caulobacter sp.]|nr:LytTR family DNA-binding domain-containing protein [Caulobacter sp.]
MWRILLLAGLFAALATMAQAQDGAWEICKGRLGPAGPMLADCRPAPDIIDPQGRSLWIRSTLPAPGDPHPRALYVVGVAASEAWLNGRRLGANGRPGATARTEAPGRYQIAMPIPDTAWRPGPNTLVLQLSSFHGPLRLARPMTMIGVARYPFRSSAPMLAITFIAAGALFAAAFGFGVIHLLRRTGSSLILSAMAALAGLQAVVESLRSLVPYDYPLHVWRLSAIWLLSAAFALLLVAYVASRFLPKARGRMVGWTLPVVAVTGLAPGFDLKTGLALLAGVLIALAATGIATARRQPGAAFPLTWLAIFVSLAVLFPAWLTDLSFFLLVAGLVLPLLMAEVLRLGRDDQGREAALTRAASRPNQLTVASARGVERVPLADIVAIVGADDYVELRLAGRSLLHAARLDELEAALPAGFQRIHRSAIANLAYAERLEREGGRWRLHVAGEAMPVSRSRLPGLRAAFKAASSDGGGA